LIEIGADGVVEERAWIRASHVAHGYLTIKPISIGAGTVIGVRSGVAGGAVLGEGVFLADLSCAGDGVRIPDGEEWAGTPARPSIWHDTPAYDPAKQPSNGRLVFYGVLQSLLALFIPFFDTVPFLFTAFLFFHLSFLFQHY